MMDVGDHASLAGDRRCWRVLAMFEPEDWALIELCPQHEDRVRQREVRLSDLTAADRSAAEILAEFRGEAQLRTRARDPWQKLPALPEGMPLAALERFREARLHRRRSLRED
jgi:hypothetical protein